MIINLIDSFFDALAAVLIIYILYLGYSKAVSMHELKIKTSNHYLKKMISAQNHVIASLCNALHR